MTREEIISEIESHCNVVDGELRWVDLCKVTRFDSFITALAWGLNWVAKISDIKTARLKSILFNIKEFPK